MSEAFGEQEEYHPPPVVDMIVQGSGLGLQEFRVWHLEFAFEMSNP